MLKALYDGNCEPGDPVEGLIDSSVEFVDSGDGIERITSLVAAGRTPLVMDENAGKPLAVLTKIDLLSYLSQRR